MAAKDTELYQADCKTHSQYGMKYMINLTHQYGMKYMINLTHSTE